MADTNHTARATLSFAEWVCPLCGQQKRVILQPNDALNPVEKPIANLRAHIRTTGDELHGRPHEYPDQFSPGELADHCSTVDGGVDGAEPWFTDMAQ